MRWGVPFWGMVSMMQVSKGLFLTYLWFVMWFEPLVGGSVFDVVCGAVPSSCRRGPGSVSCDGGVAFVVRYIFPMFVLVCL